MNAFPLILILLATVAPMAHAEEQYAIRRAVEAGQLKPLNEILTRIQASHPGKVLDVDLERDLNGRRIYEITILKADGQRAKLHVDAVSGGEIQSSATPPGPRIDMARALHKLLSRHPGTVLELELKRDSEQRMIYEIQVILHDGRLREFVIDAQRGDLINGDGHRQETLKKLKPLPDILERLPARYRGVIKEIELEYDQHGQYFYEIEILLPDGRIVELDIDAASGKVLNEEASGP